MDHQVITKDDYLLCELSGTYHFEQFKNLFSILIAESKKSGLNRILIDVLQVDNLFPEDMDRFFLGRELARQFKYKYKVAVCSPEDQITHFGENAAQNRGAWMKIFPDLEQALEWLLKL